MRLCRILHSVWLISVPYKPRIWAVGRIFPYSAGIQDIVVSMSENFEVLCLACFDFHSKDQILLQIENLTKVM